MRVKDGFELHEICGEMVLIAQGVENIDFNKVVSFNETSAFLWKEVYACDFTSEDLAEKLCKNYEVNRDEALQDADALVLQWKEAGLLV
jgi:hypothetical protein